MPSTHLGAERLRRVVEQVLRLHDGEPFERLVRVELQLSGVGREGHGVVIPHHAERDEVDQLGHDGIHLARHDRRAGLQRRQVDLGEARARSRGEQDQVARDLRQLDRDALQRRGIDDEPLLVPGRRQHVGGGHDRLAGELRQMLAVRSA